jgi:bifunctional DNase/RNase
MIPNAGQLTKCAWQGCLLAPVVSAGAIQRRRRDRLLFLCKEHATEYRQACFAASFASDCRCAEVGYTAFDAFLVFHWADHSTLWFREVGGRRGIGFVTGPAEGYSLQARLGAEPPPIPSVHGVLVSVANLLGGKVNRIVVKNFFTDRYLVIQCALVLEQGSKCIEVPVKASDAFAIAIETTAPIIVRTDMLERLPQYREGSGGLL